MINVSTAFKNRLKNGKRKYYEYADITLKNGTILNLTNKDFWQGGMSIEGAVSSDNAFDIGAAIINKSTLTINNIYDTFSEYVFEDAKVVLYVGLDVSDSDIPQIEKIRKGTYTIKESKFNVSFITLELLDNMSKFDKKYSESKLIYPATLNQIVRDACSICGVSLQTFNFPHDDFIVQNRPVDEAITFREIISWCAQIAGCFARCDVYGRLEIKWFNQNALENPETNVDKIHNISSTYASPEISQDDVVITAVRVIEKNTGDNSQEALITYQTGENGYVVTIENNELIKQGAGQTIAQWLGNQLIGFRFRKAEINHASDPSIEEGDVAILTDRKGNKYKIVVSSTNFSTGGSQNTKSNAESPSRNSAERFSAETKNYVEFIKNLIKEKNDREKALQELSKRLEESGGAFTTVEKDETGGSTFYLHNKPLLSESDMIWKMTAEAWGVSTDGGETWNAGMTVDGDTIVRILTATGINADWINTGAITIKDSKGNIVFSVDMDTKKVIISGSSVRIGSRPIEQVITDNLDEAKKYTDENLDNLKVGGRNLLINSKIEQKTTFTGASNDSGSTLIKYDFSDYAIEKLISGTTITIGFDWEATGTVDGKFYFQTAYNSYTDITGRIELSENNKSGRFTKTTELTGTGFSMIRVLGENSHATLSIKNIKVEIGDKSTDWSPSPEDMVSSDQLSETRTQLDILEKTISSLVVDENGSSLMTQTGDGWTFNIGGITDKINKAVDSLNTLENNVNEVENLTNNVKDLVDDVTKKTAYITLATDGSGNPCIELGKEGNPFKVRITNTAIDFIDNGNVIAYVNNQSMYIESAVIKNELKIGDGAGYIWRRRSNGNLGLRFVGAVK